jgi:hypothetical protein
MKTEDLGASESLRNVTIDPLGKAITLLVIRSPTYCTSFIEDGRLE